jgi:hypothetical protein
MQLHMQGKLESDLNFMPQVMYSKATAYKKIKK